MRELIPQTLSELWRPHVTIYLDRSPEECLENIKKNGQVNFCFFFLESLPNPNWLLF